MSSLKWSKITVPDGLTRDIFKDRGQDSAGSLILETGSDPIQLVSFANQLSLIERTEILL